MDYKKSKLQKTIYALLLSANEANSYFEVLSSCHRNQNFGQNGLEFFTFCFYLSG
jgi:hypothetical protein